MSTPALHLLTGAYAANALSPQERAAFREHLAECATCADEVRELQGVAAALGESLPETSASHLRAGVFAEVARTPQELRRRPLDAPVAAARHGSRGARVLVAASVVALFVATGASVVAFGQHQRMADEAGRSSAISQVLTADDAHTFGAPVAGGGSATVVMSQSASKALFVGKALPAAAAGQVYKIWVVMNDGREIPAGSFVPRSGVIVVPIAHDLHGVAEVALTVQSAADSTDRMPSPIAMVDLRT